MAQSTRPAAILSVLCEVDKVTPGKVRYSDGENVSQYIPKALLPTPHPQRVKITVEVAE